MIKEDGWEMVRQTGSHRQFRHETKPGTVTVAGHLSDDVHPKIATSVFKQAGIDSPK
ncbi:MAG: type II toxin-antitoxin system HicA family toxin [Planctomycetaceae bacterium]|nr:type II toxin-antitoxin system HicA family toxin [Planctomycetaceae bacterium]